MIFRLPIYADSIAMMFMSVIHRYRLTLYPFGNPAPFLMVLVQRRSVRLCGSKPDNGHKKSVLS